MTAEDIRDLNVDIQRQLLATESTAAHTGGSMSAVLSIMAEMAAQLAEANVHLGKLCEEVENVESPWVGFVDDHGELLSINRDDVAALREGNSNTSYVYLRGVSNSFCVRGSASEVCSRLGIQQPSL